MDETRTDRLSLKTLARIRSGLRPRVDPSARDVGIVHLGVGAFHRAHQAAFTEDAVEACGGDWGICGVTQRSRAVLDQIGPQDGLYTILTRAPDGAAARVIGVVREVLFAGSDVDRVLRRIADSAVRVITLTVTEKGYRHDPSTGRLHREDAGTRADLAGAPPQTVVGQLVRGLQERMHNDAGPIAVLCCDNLSENGRMLANLVTHFVEMQPAADANGTLSWIEEQVRFPSSVVDRIVPAATAEDRAAVRRMIGLHDEGAVVTEPFRQWVIEDSFPGGRPRWEAAGALLTADLGPYELLKLRMLNGAHSALAYLGALAGCETISDTVAHDAFGTVAQQLMRMDVRPTLNVPADLDVSAYERQLLERFANPALRHRTVQVAMDGSQKLPQRLLPTLRARRAAGAEPRWVALAVAAWMRWVWTERTDVGALRVLDDPLAPALRQAVAGADSAADVVTRLLAVSAVFGDDLRDDPQSVRLLTDALQRLTADGALAAAQALVAESRQA